ncbi:head-tail connector protein [Streptomyces caniscabiei]|uniref:Phage gp6-like head-tail connector protein n=1 Tax=Streptomyces caniscabiei TaxID=2746961 RepID=A0ABU4MI91_9ACTN|nr:head-tail connector protein [Streptomyces caniscabiei]MBE4790915.1 phage gp6-like head-tail connector protein [Streptomyces caniscabiei]MDX2953343.1 phage gp6-like head-tail connector protein [Streptomyces caniscabiei]MDX2987320.1 phage gp6-like head-tail connector protein [Streptomyces caniscabiei]MDX3009543.1 phage gp6-like head-tail connector protein [Streptomyces caniscabiei]MDX3037188.1 phage gp6-like head-tail connector protein [Streptomyces caniscabiei]
MALLTLAEAKTQLDIDGSSHDTELQVYVDGVTAAIEAHVGPVENRSVTETHTARGVRQVVLLQTPAVSLTSVVPVLTNGTTYQVAALDLDGATGVVQRLDGGRMYGPLRFTYVAGRTSVPATINLAARIMVQHLWRTQYGASRAGASIGGGDDFSVTEPVAGWGYAIPNRVLQLLEPYKLPPAVL